MNTGIINKIFFNCLLFSKLNTSILTKFKIQSGKMVVNINWNKGILTKLHNIPKNKPYPVKKYGLFPIITSFSLDVNFFKLHAYSRQK